MMHLKVIKQKAEKVRRKLLEEGLLDTSMKVEYEGDYILFPVKSSVVIEDCELVERAGRKKETKPRSLHDALKESLTQDDLNLLPSSYSVIGDIAVLELNERLLKKKELIGDAILKTYKNIKVVALKVQEVSGEYRIPGIEIIAGEKRKETLHREHGCVYKLDIASTYFSPRLGSERLRVVSQIKDTEKVMVLFTGIGPYAILASKKTKADVTAVELNPKAVEYLRWNVLRNKVKVNVVEGDARQVISQLGLFDRIIMPLPKLADTFLDVTLPALKKEGIIHYYTFARNTLEATSHLAETIGGLDRKMIILEVLECGSYSPCMNRICVDFKVV